ncbi:kinase-like protein [Coniochaeta ligniaria NRRL 30616]|uniref:EKC/KEOPS complex subunit BUD32 n=1 Tax=Coniochaeta ligniaria NRRL 30616 TaxID=1408157 RepID=A0A1J7JHS1_9PEZI|nr:kinase-like protein [Coniochaeta ligniaria NRRL 30616]
MSQQEQEHQFPPPKVLTYPSATSPLLITQGAEGRLYKTTYLLPTLPCALKYRPPKPYRHPTLDARLTRARILAEARVLARCRRDGVPVPAVYAVDEGAGWLMMEWIEGVPVRVGINAWLGERVEREEEDGEQQQQHGSGKVGEDQEPLADVMRRVGAAVGKLHKTGIVHGDLTTSNMMLRPREGHGQGSERESLLEGEIVLIDFGLATQSAHEEDRAVDLYVLERAFGSTHPRAESFFDEVLAGYRESFKHAPQVLKKLEDVRMRGRKRSMLG